MVELRRKVAHLEDVLRRHDIDPDEHDTEDQVL